MHSQTPILDNLQQRVKLLFQEELALSLTLRRAMHVNVGIQAHQKTVTQMTVVMND